MKRVVLIMATAFALSACGGGGGGGAAPSVNLDDSRDDSQIEQPILTETEQTQARSLANDLRSEIVDSGIGTEQDSLLRKIDSLVNDIDAARKTINDLLAEMTELRSQLKDALKVAETQTEPPPLNCGANEEIIGGNCECISGYVRKNNICEPESPPPNCGANEIADGQNCVCVDGYQRNNSGMCEMIPPNCGANEMADGQNCVCVDGYQRNNSGMCEMIPPNCGANEEESNGICKCISGYVRKNNICEPESPPLNCGANEEESNGICKCISGYVRKNNICEPESPPLNCGANEEESNGICKCISGYVQQNGACELPPPNCDANEMVDGQNCVCVDGYQRNNSGMCEMIPPNCGANEIADGQNCVCISGYVRQNGVCELPPPNCDANEMADGQNCVCVDGYQRNNSGMCEMIPPPCSDFRERNEQGECSYDTAEYRGLLHPEIDLYKELAGYEYAYSRGYHGQSVTVVVGEAVSRTHENLRANVISVSTGLDCRGLSLGFHNPALGEQFLNAYNCDEFNENALDSFVSIWGYTPEMTATINLYSLYHGEGVAGIIAAPRNGITMHGVAPRSKLIPIPLGPGFRLHDRTDDLRYIVDNKIPIVNHSTWYPATGTNMSLFMKHYREVAADSDTIFVFAGGNYGSPHKFSRLNQATVPRYEKDLEDNWLIVGNYHYNFKTKKEAIITIHCGEAKMWCINAFHAHRTPGLSGDDKYVSFFGSSSAAPHVSGALALLKSAAPELPMTMIRQILLTTATDIGDDGIDEEFGWGVVNVSAGIEHIENLETAEGTALRDLRGSLPYEMSHLRGRLSDVSVALKITDDSYYNIPLSDIVGGGDSDLPKTSLGNAAKEMQADDSLSPENSGFGFNYANGDYDLHYASGGGENAFRFSGGLRHDDSQSSYIGEGSSPFAAENASDTGGYVKWTTADYAGLSAFGEYGRTQIKADYDSNSFVSKIQNARAEEWTAGFQYRDLFLHNDNLQFSARQESRISGGEMVLHYPIADGDSHKAFIGESVQTIRTETARIPIKQKPQTIYTAGYSQKTENSKWSAAAEWNSATNAKGVSFAVELQIR